MSPEGRHIVVSAGGTREPIDPVRYIGNRSSGKMGFAIADAAKDRRYRVTLVTTVKPPDPNRYDDVRMVETVSEMREAVLDACESADVVVMSAAVSDYRVQNPAKSKLKKKGENLVLELVQTEDFMLEMPDTLVKVGFAAETDDVLNNAEKKLKAKRCDFICANDVSAPDSGFAVDTNRVTILHRGGKQEALPLMTKREVAEIVMDRIEEYLTEKENS